jgi:hypothetical protein
LPRIRLFWLIIGSIIYLSIAASDVNAATYYLDAVNGSDNNPGTIEQPWKTIVYAEEHAANGSTVYVRDGNYGNVEISRQSNSGRSGWNDAITFTPDSGATPYMTYLYIHGWYGETPPYNIYDRYLIFDGVDILYPDPGKYQEIGAGARVVHILEDGYIQIKNCVIQGILGVTDDPNHLDQYWQGSSTDYIMILGAFDITRGIRQITIENCDIRNSGTFAISIQDPAKYLQNAEGIVIKNNQIHNFGASGIAIDGNVNKTITIQGNQIYNQPDVWVRNFSTTHHGSLMEMRTGYINLIGNILRSGGNTAPITCYQSNTSGFHNVLIENNLVYDSKNINCAILYYVGNNFIFRNNTIIGGTWAENGPNYFGTALSVQSFFSGADKSTVKICNNILVGHAEWPSDSGSAVIKGNIMYSHYDGSWRDQAWMNSNYPGNKVYNSYPPATSTGISGFTTSGTVFIGGSLFDTYGFKWGIDNVDLGHSFDLAPNSIAVDYADPHYAPVTDIWGTTRVSSPDAGCDEYIPVDPNNHAPVLQSIGNKSINENVLLTFTVSATDADGDTINYSAQNLPQGAALSNQTFSWTPNYNQAGSYQVTFIANDGHAQDTETITITVNNVNRTPVLAAIGNKSVSENNALSFSVSASDADGEMITYTAPSLPSGAAFAGQTFTWTPNYNQAGAYQVTFIASDGQAQDSKAITITVNNVNRAPVLSSIGNKSASANQSLTFAVDATDPDGDTLTYSATGVPSGATFTSKTFSWTPSEGQVGSFSVTFTASDGQSQDSEAITIVVTGTDTSPPSVTDKSPASNSIQIPLNSLIILHVVDAGQGVDANSVTIKVNDNTVYSGDTAAYSSAYGTCRRSGAKLDYAFTYQSKKLFGFNEKVQVKVNAADLAGNIMSEYSYSFKTEMRSFGRNKSVGSITGYLGEAKPATVRDGSNNIWTVWQAGQAGSRDIYISELADGADNFSTPIKITDNSADQLNPAIAVDDSDKIYVAWQDNRQGNWDVYLSTSSNGVTWSAARRITDSNDNQVNPGIVIDNQSPNRAYIVWQDDRGGNQNIYIASSNNSFVTSTVMQITSDASDQVEPAIAVSSDNTVYCLWKDLRNSSSDIYGAASNNGSWTNVPIVNKAGNQSSPAIAAESSGSILHFLWVDDISGNKDIYYASSNGLPTNPLTGISIIDDSSGANQLEPAIVAGGSTGNNLRVFACWRDERNVYGNSADTDIYFAELSSDSLTNVFVGEDGANADQKEPAINIDEYGNPYIVWTDSRNSSPEIYYAGSTYSAPTALASADVSAATGATVGTQPGAISSVDDVSVVVPAGAYSCDVTVTVSKVNDPPAFEVDCLTLAYEFSPSGITFTEPVTITIPYVVSDSSKAPSAYWYDSLTGTLSQDGITDVKDLVITSNLHALQFKTTHFTPFIGGSSDENGSGGGSNGGGGGGGGCSLSNGAEGSIAEFFLPYCGLAIVMVMLKLRDKRKQAKVQDV